MLFFLYYWQIFKSALAYLYKLTQNAPQIILYYHMTKEFLNCLNLRMFWKNIDCFRFWWKTYTKLYANNNIISRVGRPSLTSLCNWSVSGGGKLGNLGNVRNLGNFFRLFLFQLFDFGIILKIENSEEENSESKFRSFRRFQRFWVFDLPLFDLAFSSGRLGFLCFMAFLFSFLTLFELVILGYWAAIIQRANLCLKWHE